MVECSNDCRLLIMTEAGLGSFRHSMLERLYAIEGSDVATVGILVLGGMRVFSPLCYAENHVLALLNTTRML